MLYWITVIEPETGDHVTFGIWDDDHLMSKTFSAPGNAGIEFHVETVKDRSWYYREHLDGTR